MASSELYTTKYVDAREPFASTDPVHQRMGKSIFHLRVDCEKCGIGGYGSCFLLQDLSKDCDGDYVYFATAAHNLYCVSFPEKEKNPNCETGCNQYRVVRIIGRWNWKQVGVDETSVYLTDNIGKNSKAGWLKVSNKYEKSAKSVQFQVKVRKADAATHKAQLDRFTYDFGVIAALKDDLLLLDNTPSLLPGPDEQVPVFCGKEEPIEENAYLCGYPGKAGNHSAGKDPPDAQKCKYWVPSANRVVVLDPKMLKHYVDSSGGQSGAPLYKLPPSGKGEAPCVLGIHVGGDPKSNPGDRHNLAVKLRTDSPTLRTIRGWVLNAAEYDRDDTVEPVPFEGATSEMIEEPNVFTLPVSMEGDKKPSHGVVQKPQASTSAPGVHESLDQQLSDMTAWESKVFTELRPDLVSTLTPGDMRRQCEAKGLITRTQRQLFADRTGRAAQNEELLDALITGDNESFHTFLECIRKVEPPASARRLLAKLEPVDKFRAARQYC